MKPCKHCGNPLDPKDINYRKKLFCGRACYVAMMRDPKLDEARFWGRVNKTDGCWLWTGWALNSGYGEHGRARRMLAHRYSYALANGPIPKGQLVLHKCDTPLCVRPDHLFLGTDADNMRDRWTKGRKPYKFTAERIRAIRAEFAGIKGRCPQGFQKRIAEKYKTADRWIWAIRTGRAWSHIK